MALVTVTDIETVVDTKTGDLVKTSQREAKVGKEKTVHDQIIIKMLGILRKVEVMVIENVIEVGTEKIERKINVEVDLATEAKTGEEVEVKIRRGVEAEKEEGVRIEREAEVRIRRESTEAGVEISDPEVDMAVEIDIQGQFCIRLCN